MKKSNALLLLWLIVGLITLGGGYLLSHVWSLETEVALFGFFLLWQVQSTSTQLEDRLSDIEEKLDTVLRERTPSSGERV